MLPRSSLQQLNTNKSESDTNDKPSGSTKSSKENEQEMARVQASEDEQKNNKSKFICELCDTYDNVNYHCMECNQNMCNCCNRIHSRTKPAFGHSVVDINLWDKYSVEVQCHNHPICPEHPEKVYHLSLYCSNCMEIVCGYCRRNLRRPRINEPPIEGLPELSEEEKKLQELYLQLEYYKEVEKMILLDQGIDTRKTPEKPMMADKVKEFMKKFTDRIDKIRKEMITKVNTHYEKEKQVRLEYTYRDKIDALEEKIEAYNQKLFDHSKAKYMNAAKESGIDLAATYKAIDKEREEEKKAAAARAELDKRRREDVVNDILQEKVEGEEEKGEKIKRRVRSPTFIPGEVEEDQIKEMIQEYILNGETPELIAKEEALIREMFGKLEYEIIEEREDGVTEVTKIKHLGDEINLEDIEKSSTENAENMEGTETKKETCDSRKDAENGNSDSKDNENIEEKEKKIETCDSRRNAENSNSGSKDKESIEEIETKIETCDSRRNAENSNSGSKDKESIEEIETKIETCDSRRNAENSNSDSKDKESIEEIETKIETCDSRRNAENSNSGSKDKESIEEIETKIETCDSRRDAENSDSNSKDNEKDTSKNEDQ